MAAHSEVRVAVIGAGPVGLAAGHALKEKGFDNLTIFEKSDGVGGTWHTHSYPGLTCDVKSPAYTFSFAPNRELSSNYVTQGEIEDYLQRCSAEFGLDRHIRLNAKVDRARYQGDGTWSLTTAAGDEHVFDFVINAMGNQHTPIFPEIEGMENFQGVSWHGTQWNHDYDLTGKRVAIVGSAASSIQIVPEIAKRTSQLYVLQRTPNWILPRGKKDYSPLSKALMRLPGASGLFRRLHDRVMNLSHGGAILGHKMMDTIETMGSKHLAAQVEDEALRALLTPGSRFGCKRPLVSDDFYPALQRDDVELVASAAAAITETGIVTEDGRNLEVDVIVYCTGYKILDFERIDVVGENGRSLAAQMEQAPEAYKGVAVPGFPNYFLGVGPNGVLLSASFFTAAELNLACIVKLLVQKEAAGAKSIVVKEQLHREHNDWMRAARDGFSWASSSCDSYYRTPSGHTPFLFPGDIKLFRRHRDEAGLHEFDVT